MNIFMLGHPSVPHGTQSVQRAAKSGCENPHSIVGKAVSPTSGATMTAISTAGRIPRLAIVSKNLFLVLSLLNPFENSR